MAAGGQQQTRRAVLGGAALLASQLAIGHPTASDAATTPKRPPVARLPEEFDTPQLKGLSGDENPNLPQFRALPSGVRITDIQVGNGAEVKEGSTVSVQWVLRRSNGYFVDSSEAHNYDPFIYRVGDAQKAIKGFDEGIRGMKQGGKRRMIVPPELGYVQGAADNKPGPVPTGYGPQRQVTNRKNEPFFFEVEVSRVRDRSN